MTWLPKSCKLVLNNDKLIHKSCHYSITLIIQLFSLYEKQPFLQTRVCYISRKVLLTHCLFYIPCKTEKFKTSRKHYLTLPSVLFPVSSNLLSSVDHHDPCSAEFILGNIKYTCIFYNFFALRWHRQLKPSPKKKLTCLILHIPYHGFQCLDLRLGLLRNIHVKIQVS